MAKPLPLLVGVLGIGATATGGVILMNRGGSGDGTGASAKGENTAQTSEEKAIPAAEPGAASGAQSGRQGGGGDAGPKGQQTDTNDQSRRATEDTQSAKDLMFADVAGFKSMASTSKDCLTSDFTKLDLSLAGSQDFGEGKPEENKFFQTPSGSSTPTTKSCLIINWKKSKAEDKKWTGKFTWLWTFMRGDEGFINFNVMEPTEDGEKAKFTGVFYLVEKKSGEAKWEVKFKKEVDSAAKEVESKDLDDYFPKPGAAIKAASNDLKDYWDFMESKDKMNELCPDPKTCTEDPKVQKFHWTVSGASDGAEDKSVKEWSENLTWWEKIYGVNDNWKLADKVKEIKGKWALQSSVPQESQ